MTASRQQRAARLSHLLIGSFVTQDNLTWAARVRLTARARWNLLYFAA